MNFFKIFTSLCICAVTMIACEKEPQIQEKEFGANESAQRTVSDTTLLAFSSEEEMFQQIHELKQLKDEARTAWNTQRNFVSQFDFKWRIVDELDKAVSLDEVRQIQAKYGEVMLFNNNPADEDISPYIPSDYRGTEFVCNKNGDVLIDGVVKNYNNLTSYEQTPNYKFEHQDKTRARNKIAEVAAVAGKRKFWVQAYYNTKSGWVELQLSAHAKGAFGWNNYRTSYFLKLTDFDNWYGVGPLAIKLLSVRYNFYETAEVASDNYYPFVTGRVQANKSARFYIYAFSRGVGAGYTREFGVVNSPRSLSRVPEGYFELGESTPTVK